jgi:hypothetical protein
MKNSRFLLLLSGFALFALHAEAALAEVAGHVQFVHGTVQVTTPAGLTRPVQKGEAINEGDMLTSAKEASAQIRMRDGGFIAVRPGTRMKFDQFRFRGKEDGEERGFFSLFKGGFRAVTGLIGRLNKHNYRITTPAATIGIRGTDHEAFVVTPDSALAGVAPAGAYSKVNVGETTLTTDRGTINVLPNQMGFAGGMSQMPQLQPVNTNLFTVAPPPKEEVRLEQKEGGEGESENGQASGEQEGAADAGGEHAGETAAADTGGEQTAGETAAAEEAPIETVRETAVVDGTPPAAGTAPAATTPLADAGGTTVVEVAVAPPVVVAVDGQTLNVTDQTITSSTGTTTTITPTTVATAAYVQSDLAITFVSGGSAGGVPPYVYLDTMIAKPADVNGALPNPSFTDRYAGKDSSSYVTYTLNGTTTIGQPTITLSNGIKFGRFDSTSAERLVVGNTDCCTAGTTLSNSPVYLHWAVGPALSPVYLPEVLIGTATYTLAGSTTPTVSSNATPPTATLNAAALSVNFAQQVVAFNLSLTVGGNAWTASASNVPLGGLYWNSARVEFRATSFTREGWAPLTVTGASNADVVGQLTGKGLDGAILSYVFNGANYDQVTGVAAFTGTVQNTATPYRIAALSTIDAIPAGQPNGGTMVPVTMGGYNNSVHVVMDAAGNLTQFRADKHFTSGGVVTVSNVGAAVGRGTDPVSGISWGRWQGNVRLNDIVNNSTTTLTQAPFSHWIAGPVMTGPVALPVSGTYNYTLAGGTAPTDSRGGVGTLNSASLTANFTAQTVNIGLNVTTPNAGNLVASGTNIPIEQKNFFGATTANALNGGTNLGLLTVTCPGGCGGATVSGEVGGVFVGTGGIGAGMVYGFKKDTVIVNGVAAFHR